MERSSSFESGEDDISERSGKVIVMKGHRGRKKGPIAALVIKQEDGENRDILPPFFPPPAAPKLPYFDIFDLRKRQFGE